MKTTLPEYKNTLIEKGRIENCHYCNGDQFEILNKKCIDHEGTPIKTNLCLCNSCEHISIFEDEKYHSSAPQNYNLPIRQRFKPEICPTCQHDHFKVIRKMVINHCGAFVAQYFFLCNDCETISISDKDQSYC